MEYEEALRHAGPIYRADRQHALEERARQALPHYMFTWKEGGKRRGYCTNCLNDVYIRKEDALPYYVVDDPYADDEDGFHHPERAYGFEGPYRSYGHFDGSEGLFDMSGKHLHWGDCPCCGCRVQYRGMGMGRKTLQDRIFLIQYQRSAADENAIVMLGWLCVHEWGRWDEYNESLPECYMDLREICVFQPGQKGERFVKRIMWTGDPLDGGKVKLTPHGYWHHPKKCKGGFDPWGGSLAYQFGNDGTPFFLDADTVETTLAGSWMDVWWQKWKADASLDCINWMERMTSYPCMEYFCKLGLETLAHDLVCGQMAPRLLNHRGKTAQKVLRVDGDCWGWIKGNHVDVTQGFLELYHAAKKLRLRYGYDKLLRLSKTWSAESLTLVAEAVGAENVSKTLNYILKKGISCFDYADHLDMMGKLGMNTRDPAMLWPKDFQALHTELSKRIEVKADGEAAERMDKRTDALAGWWFSALGLTIRPFLSPAEIIREGSEMRHCVGGYVKRYAEGGTVLLALREEERPTTPWRTVEYTCGGKLVQCRGFRNQSPADEQDRIDEFFKLFDAYRAEYELLNGKKHKRAKAAA